MTDIEIAKNVKLENIENIAKKAGIEPEDIECYGKYKAKISDKIFEKVKKQENGKLVLVTAISPTPLGEGKTTISIAIADGLQKIEKINALPKRAITWPCFWYKRRSNRWGTLTSSSNGRYKFAFYR